MFIPPQKFNFKARKTYKVCFAYSLKLSLLTELTTPLSIIGGAWKSLKRPNFPKFPALLNKNKETRCANCSPSVFSSPVLGSYCKLFTRIFLPGTPSPFAPRKPLSKVYFFLLFALSSGRKKISFITRGTNPRVGVPPPRTAKL